MNDDNFKKLVKRREEWVRSSKENDFDFDSILSGLYNDPSHFIYEILQNAEDADASSISFNLSNDKLEINHNSKNDFDFDDVDGITGIGISTKKDELNKIGKFGVGFKSVFAITQSPIIASGEFHFKIVDFVLPQSLSPTENTGTNIKLPFNHPTRERNKIFKLVDKKLQDINLKTLLFLSNITKIKWRTPSQNGYYSKSVKTIDNVQGVGVNKVSIFLKTDNEKRSEQYLVLDKPITIADKELKVEIAYKLEADENGKEQIVSVPDQESKLVVYFPTEKITYLNFIIQGPFKTTPNRENIPLEGDQNKSIITEIKNLVAESLPIVKHLKYLTTSFLEVLPLSDKNCDEPIYASIFGGVINKFLCDEKLLPTNHGGFSHPNDSILARGKILTKLLKSQDIKILFEKSHWLDTNITSGKTSELRDYLINKLGIDEIGFEDFSKKIDEEFLKSKNDEWVVDLYRELIDRDALFSKRTEGILRSKPIIRLKNNQHCSPFDSLGKIQVYLPAKTKSSYKTVKNSIAQNETALEFLKKLDISKPDIFAEINELILPKYSNDKTNIDDEYFEDLEKILTAFSKEKSTDKREELITALKDLRVIDSVNPVTGESYLIRPSEVYLDNKDLRNYFDGYDNAWFINKDLYKKFGQKNFEEFALKIGCNKTPRRIGIKGDLTWEEKNQLRNNDGCSSESYTRDYIIDGLDNIISNAGVEYSALIFKMLLKSLSNYDGRNKSKFFDGKYGWVYYSDKFAYFDSKFKKILCSKNWLFDSNSNQVCPNEVTISELADDYITEDENIEVLVQALGFQLDKIKQIEKEYGGKFVSDEDFDLLQEIKKERTESQDDSVEEEEWEPDVLPDEVETTISEATVELVDSEDLTYQPTGVGSNEIFNNEKEEYSDENEGTSKKAIGDWGEKFVFQHFSKNKFSELIDITNTELGFSGKDKFNNIIEVKWLNRNKGIGKGYDFVIVENGIEIEYIEVKTTINADRTLHKITGMQWEFARRLFNSGDGEKYKIYAVKNAGSDNAEIKFISNPIKLWKEGNLYAHPINFRV